MAFRLLGELSQAGRITDTYGECHTVWRSEESAWSGDSHWRNVAVSNDRSDLPVTVTLVITASTR